MDIMRTYFITFMVTDDRVDEYGEPDEYMTIPELKDMFTTIELPAGIKIVDLKKIVDITPA